MRSWSKVWGDLLASLGIDEPQFQPELSELVIPTVLMSDMRKRGPVSHGPRYYVGESLTPTAGQTACVMINAGRLGCWFSNFFHRSAGTACTLNFGAQVQEGGFTADLGLFPTARAMPEISSTGQAGGNNGFLFDVVNMLGGSNTLMPSGTRLRRGSSASVPGFRGPTYTAALAFELLGDSPLFIPPYQEFTIVATTVTVLMQYFFVLEEPSA